MQMVPMMDTPHEGGRRFAKVPSLCNGTGVVQKSAAYTPVVEDSGKIFHDLTNAVTFTFEATLPIGWWCIVKHVANTTITLAAGSGATINGASSLAADNTMDPHGTALIIKTSAADFSAFLVGTWT